MSHNRYDVEQSPPVTAWSEPGPARPSALVGALHAPARRGHHRESPGRDRAAAAGADAVLAGVQMRDGDVDLDAGFGPPDTPEYSVSTNWTGYAGLRLDLLGGRLKNRLAVTRDTI